MVLGSLSQACQVCGRLTRCLGSRAMSASSSMGPSSLAASVSRRSLKRERISCQVLRSLSSRSRVLYVLWNLSTHGTSYGTCQHTSYETCQHSALLMKPVNTQHFLLNLSILSTSYETCQHTVLLMKCQHTALLMKPVYTQHFIWNLSIESASYELWTLSTHSTFYKVCQQAALLMEPVNRQCFSHGTC